MKVADHNDRARLRAVLGARYCAWELERKKHDHERQKRDTRR
jgi:hypothetical protein